MMDRMLPCVGYRVRLVGVLFCMIAMGRIVRLPAESPVRGQIQRPVQNPVQRASGDRDDDLIDALLSKGRFEDAKVICRIQQASHQKNSSNHALATTRLTAVLMEQQIAMGKFDSAAVAIACEPVDQLLGAYPEHSRRLFLEASKLSASQAAIQMAVAVAAINLNDSSNALAVTARLTRSTRLTESLMERVRQASADDSNRSDSNRSDSSIASDLVRLEQELLVATVSMSLLQTELFPPESTDAIAAATTAMEAAIAAREKLPSQSLAVQETQRMEIVAMLRSGNPKLAFEHLERMLEQTETEITPSLTAVRIETLLALDRTQDAMSLLRSHQQNPVSNRAASIDIDLAQLKFYLHTGDMSAASNWMVELEERHGVYARRRAEAIAISKLDRLETNQLDSVSPEKLDSSPIALIETRGRQLIRSGDLQAGAKLLARAAQSSASADQSFPIAMTAAAAFQKSGLPREASGVLTDVAIRYPDASQSSSIHLQATVMLTQGPAPANTQAIQTRLEEHLRTWPESETVDTAASWLIRILDSQGRSLESAQVATTAARARRTPQWITTMNEKWSAIFLNSDSFDQDLQISRQAIKTIAVDPIEPSIVAAVRTLAAIGFDPRALQSVPEQSADEPDWVESILRFRRDSATAVSLESLRSMDPLVRRRLIRDGQRKPGVRRSVASLLQKLEPIGLEPDRGSTPLEPAIIQLWIGNVDGSIQWVESWRQNQPSVDGLIEAATIFQDASSVDANAYAVQLWDRLAAGSKLGSLQWHRAKTAAIQALHQSGKNDEASKRAHYILLTTQDLSAQQRQTYQDLAR